MILRIFKKNYNEIERLVNKFIKIKLSESDPLNIIIEKAKKYIIENA